MRFILSVGIEAQEKSPGCRIARQIKDRSACKARVSCRGYDAMTAVCSAHRIGLP
jgi:hypothetical protein